MKTDYTAVIILGILIAGAIGAYALGATDIALTLTGIASGQMLLKQPFTFVKKTDDVPETK